MKVYLQKNPQPLVGISGDEGVDLSLYNRAAKIRAVIRGKLQVMLPCTLYHNLILGQ
jgi:hypothetical protein